MIDNPPENTPPEVQQHAAEKQALMTSGNDESLPPEDDLTDEEKAANVPTVPRTISGSVPTTDPLEAFAQVLQQRGDRKEVKVHTPIGAIVLRALHVSINAHGVGMILNKDDMHLDPALGTELKVEIDGRPLSVVYAGGLFTFKRIPVTFLSFLRLDDEAETKQDKDHGEERES